MHGLTASKKYISSSELHRVCDIYTMQIELIIVRSVQSTVILQVFGVVLFSVFSVVDGFTEIKKTPKCEKHIERSRQHPPTPKFKQHRTLRDRSPPKF